MKTYKKVFKLVNRKKKEVKELEKKIEVLKEDIIKIQTENFGISDGSMISVESFIEAILTTLENRKGGK